MAGSTKLLREGETVEEWWKEYGLDAIKAQENRRQKYKRQKEKWGTKYESVIRERNNER